MSLITKILVAYDGSQPAEKAFLYALDLAESLHVPFEVFEVLLIPGAPGFPSDTPSHAREEFERFEARSHELSSIAQARGVSPSFRIVTGLAVREIVNRAASGGFDLIVIGHHHHSALGQLLSPSVAKATIDAAPCATLVVW